ncbi:glycosyltransferase [Acidipila rosea]|uniref:Rhamnosyltransferase n=1 Tax=Acidipila rosea TaxID=768535 RepID=A0A4R1KZ99_9BACT|nr:glycosyltransferase family 2 protein [Acidipila rosea]MBW4028358.1 glycosyltransferase family 2 protein [Acidobacteriota bacterium]MBW4046262.1 glycosyltransferase family 2 protein [Acidobacteriota bacterium]TCK70824.1 rhamnosyltransferase [Acidipila rosea]
MTASIIVPTLNAAPDWPRFAPALLACARPQDVLVIDSSSTDGTADLARAAGFRVHTIAREDFSHGRTRQLAAELLPEAEILVYLTQDAILTSPDAIHKLIASFDDPSVAAAYGRQLPRPGAGPIEAHARLFNYPAHSQVRTLASRSELGFKAIFISNSFAAYRRSALMTTGGFPVDTIFGEDTVTAARMLLTGWKIAYVSDAAVYHSHSYTAAQDFRRYFDIGVLHAREPWLLKEFGTTGGEGKRFVFSEIASLWPAHFWLIPSALLRTVAKLAGYQIGRREARLPLGAKRRLSMHRGFWK